MISYKITKFDPAKRNVQGAYIDNSEWTSIDDIGKAECRNLAFDEYFETESKYVKAIRLILEEKNITCLRISSLEIYNDQLDFEKLEANNELKGIDFNYDRDIKGLRKGKNLQLENIEKITLFILRELVWMELANPEIKVIFGYDYYMYVECRELTKDVIHKIREAGLFVEPHASQASFEFIDDNGNRE